MESNNTRRSIVCSANMIRETQERTEEHECQSTKLDKQTTRRRLESSSFRERESFITFTRFWPGANHHQSVPSTLARSFGVVQSPRKQCYRRHPRSSASSRSDVGQSTASSSSHSRARAPQCPEQDAAV